VLLHACRGRPHRCRSSSTPAALFAETLVYRTELAERLGLTDVRTFAPDRSGWRRRTAPGAVDDQSRLVLPHPQDRAAVAGACRVRCPVHRAQAFQAATRAELPVFEADGPRIKINPLAGWAPSELRAYAARRSSRASAGGEGLSLDRLRAVHDAGAAGRGSTRRPLARSRQDRMRHPSSSRSTAAGFRRRRRSLLPAPSFRRKPESIAPPRQIRAPARSDRRRNGPRLRRGVEWR
jgi:hypothetical protein